MYKIGEATWHNGDEITITTEPYELYGGEWQDGIDKAGRTVTVATPRQKAANAARKLQERKEQQEGFARLNK